MCIKCVVMHPGDAESEKKNSDSGDCRSSLAGAGNSTEVANGARRASHDAISTLSNTNMDIFDDFDWELDAGIQDANKALTEEYLRKRKTVMEEKVICLLNVK